MFDLLAFGGSRETVIMGLAQLPVAAGCAMLAALSARRTDQPQCGARTAAFAFVVTGALVLIRSVRTGAPLTR